MIETIKLTGLPFEDKQFKKWFKVNQCLNNKIKVLWLSASEKDCKQKIERKIVAYMLVLEVECLGTIDLNFLYCFDNIPKKIT